MFSRLFHLLICLGKELKLPPGRLCALLRQHRQNERSKAALGLQSPGCMSTRRASKIKNTQPRTSQIMLVTFGGCTSCVKIYKNTVQYRQTNKQSTEKVVYLCADKIRNHRFLVQKTSRCYLGNPKLLNSELTYEMRADKMEASSIRVKRLPSDC